MTAHALAATLPAPRRSILGIGVSPWSWDEAIAAIDARIAAGTFTRVGFLNAHNANVACSNGEFAGALSDFLVLPDGVGVDMASKILYGSSFPANLNGTDFVPSLLAALKRPLKVGLIGTRPDNADGAAAALRRIAPQHDYAVVHHGFFTAEEEEDVLARLRALKPDILLVAMGVPRQELWIARKVGPEHCTLPIAVGALLDFLSGAVPRAPRLVRRIRMEWVYRLMVEPGRMWRRYVLGNPLFLLRVFRQKLRRRPAGLGT